MPETRGEPPTPLSTEEEAVLRQQIDRETAAVGAPLRITVARLLATLDRDRAAVPAVSHEAPTTEQANSGGGAVQAPTAGEPDPDIAAWRQFSEDIAAGKVREEPNGLIREAFATGWNAGRAEAARAAVQELREGLRAKVAELRGYPNDELGPDWVPDPIGYYVKAAAVLALLEPTDG